MKLRKGDNVMVISGKDRGKSGVIVRAFPKLGTVLIDGVNVKKKHQKARQSGKQGQIIEKNYPIHASNVMLLDPKEGGKNKKTRIGIRREGGKRVRFAKRSGHAL